MDGFLRLIEHLFLLTDCLSVLCNFLLEILDDSIKITNLLFWLCSFDEFQLGLVHFEAFEFVVYKLLKFGSHTGIMIKPSALVGSNL